MARITNARTLLAGLATAVVLTTCLALIAGSQEAPPPVAGFHFPTVPAEHKHVRALLENALRFAAPANKMIEPTSGYPVEGWNQDPDKKIFLRSFTQLTAIGLWMELLAHVVAGYADSPYLSRDQALAQLERLVESLRHDQKDPRISALGLLGNFLDLQPGRRLGPLAGEVDRKKFLDAFGPDKGQAIWKALLAKGWLLARPNDREAAIQRSIRYGAEFFDGPLAPYADQATKEKILALLDRRVVMAVFGDNANLAMAAAKSIGALLHPDVKDRPRIAQLRRKLEDFLDDQRPGYERLNDSRVGMFYFGWDVSRDRMFGWEDPKGTWKTGHVDYLVNEFRAPTTFVILRLGLPVDAVKNLGFKVKPYRMADGKDIYVLAPWEGSAFQGLGLQLCLGEMKNPSWSRLLRSFTDVELDYASRKKLPGFLSESYTGEGTTYSGAVGIPDIAVSPTPRITDAASLYTLGTAYTVAPDKIEKFLAANWSVISKLRTDHGPWEGFNITRQKPIEFETSAHTLSLILGLLGTGSELMGRYLQSRDLSGRLAEVLRSGDRVDLLSDQAQIFAWADKQSALRSTRSKTSFQVTGQRVSEANIAFVLSRPEGVNVSGEMLRLRYRCAQPVDLAFIALKQRGQILLPPGIIATEIFTHFAATGGGEKEIHIPLPATPGLRDVKEVVITAVQKEPGTPIDLTVTDFGFTPLVDVQVRNDRPG
jgi:hypothetical protein